MSRFLNWVESRSDLNDRDDSTKVNVCLLAKTKKMASVVNGITFDDPFYQEMAHTFVKNKVESVLSDLTPYSDRTFQYDYLVERKRWLEETVNNESGEVSSPSIDDNIKPPITSFNNYDTANAFNGVQQVYFDTNFGEVKKDDAPYAQFLKDQSKINYWENGRRDQYLGWVCSCGLALKCLNSDLDQTEKDLIPELDTIEITWQNYNAFVTKEMYESL
jgi:hypothetical protein